MTSKLFQGAADLRYWQRVNRELFARFMFPVDVYLYDQGMKDPLYGENLDLTFERATSEPSYSIDAYFAELPDWRSKLTKHGLDEERPLTVHFFALAFEELAAKLGREIRPPGVGDRIFVQGELYKGMKENPKDYFLNTRTAMTYSLTLQRVRRESLTPGRIAKEDDLYPTSQLGLAGTPDPGPGAPGSVPSPPGNDLGGFDLGGSDLGG